MNRSKFRNFLAGIFLAVIFFSGCEKEGILMEKQKDQCVAGLTGKYKLIIRLRHDNHFLVNLKNYRDTVYVKFNTSEFPGMDSLDYDAVYIGDYPGDSVVVDNLSCGNYYIFATGLESIHQVRVYGGIPFEVKKDKGERNIVIPVTN